MTKEAEEKFINTYIDEGYRARLIKELGKRERRTDALSRFFHGAEKLFNKSKSILRIKDIDEINRSDDPVYLISWDKNDGIYMSFSEAAEHIRNSYMSIILIGNRFAIVKEEVENGQPVIYYLKDKD